MAWEKMIFQPGLSQPGPARAPVSIEQPPRRAIIRKSTENISDDYKASSGSVSMRDISLVCAGKFAIFNGHRTLISLSPDALDEGKQVGIGVLERSEVILMTSG